MKQKSKVNEAGRCLYEQLLGPQWDDLPAEARALHNPLAPVERRGSFTVRHSSSRVARLLIRLMRLPRAGTDLPTELTITPRHGGEIWRRRFGSDDLVTRQRPARHGFLAERLGMIELWLGLEVAAGALSYRTVRGTLVVGRWRPGLPRWLCPRVDGRETSDAGGVVRVEVQLSFPPVGMLMSYTGGVCLERRETA